MALSRSDQIHLEWQNLSYNVKSSSFNWMKFKSTDNTINVLKDGIIYTVHWYFNFVICNVFSKIVQCPDQLVLGN